VQELINSLAGPAKEVYVSESIVVCQSAIITCDAPNITCPRLPMLLNKHTAQEHNPLWGWTKVNIIVTLVEIMVTFCELQNVIRV